MYLGLSPMAKKVIADTEEPVVPVVDNNLRKEWNNYTNWLASKGLKGHPSLDTGGKWEQALEMYRKENPKTILNKHIIPVIQKDFQNYRNFVIDKVKKGQGQFGAGTDETNFMKNLSVVDGIAGSKTTNFQYPNEYLQTLENGKVISSENKGFATK